MSSISDDNNDDIDHQHGGGSDEITLSKKECTSCEQINVDIIIDGINSVAVRDDKSTCASCGKEGNSDNMNTCNKCKMVKYCNAACKKKHRTKHKKACERRVAELHEENLFKEPPPPEECPICFLPLSGGNMTERFQACCGKVICMTCIYAMVMSEGKDLCPFCRTPPASSDEEEIERTKKLMEKGNAEAFNVFAGYYDRGIKGMPLDVRKANELYLKGGELGCAEAYHNLGVNNYNGHGVQVDKIKAKHYYEIAAMMGSIQSRNNLGCIEGQARDVERAIKHFVMAAKAGNKKSLDNIKRGYMDGIVTKDEYASTLRAYHERQQEMKNDARDEAAAALGYL